jgi:hypothetical protein
MNEQSRRSDRIQFIAPSHQASSLFDLSTTGACCLHTQACEKNDFVKAVINDLRLRAKVIYSQKRADGYRIGLQFWNVTPEKQAKLDALVDAYSKGVPVTCRISEDSEDKG